jgi:hypothetical protein
MLTSRGNISGWILGSSRSSLDQQTAAAVHRVDALSLLSVEGKRRIQRVLLEAAAAPALSSHLAKVRNESEMAMRDDPLRMLYGNPTREELLALLSDAVVDLRTKLNAARKYASDPSFVFPKEFVSEVRAYGQTFPVARRRVVLGWTSDDHNWEYLEPLLCRLCPEVYEASVRAFVRGVERREDEAIYPWLFSADGYISLFELPEVSVIRQAWERFLTIRGGDKGNLGVTEFTMFGMLLPYMTPQEQVQELMRRGDSRAQLVSFEEEFQKLVSPESQKQLAGLAEADDQLLPVLWYAIAQEKPDSGVWLPLIDRALTNQSSVARGFAMELLFRMPRAVVRKRLSLL